MKISVPYGSGCLGAQNATRIIVSDCADPDNVTWSFTNKPEGAPDPVITALGDGQYDVHSDLAGAFLLVGECC